MYVVDDAPLRDAATLLPAHVRVTALGARPPAAMAHTLAEADPDARLPGRGAYLHHDEACAREAVRRRGFERSLRTTVRLPDDLLESLS